MTDWSAEIDKVARDHMYALTVSREDCLALLKRVEAEVREAILDRAIAAAEADRLECEKWEAKEIGDVSKQRAQASKHTADRIQDRLRALKKGTADE